jgi:putative ABC transport system permease protein
MDTFLQDLRYAVRSLRRSPGFAAIVVLTLALGIGANTAIFSVANAVMLRPLHAPEPDRIVQFMSSGPSGAYPTVNLPTANAWLQQTNSVLEDVSAQRLDFVNLTGTPHPEQIAAARVSATFFHLFGATVEAGRTFTRDEDRPGGERVVVLSHRLWLRRFGGDAAILGHTIVLGTQPYQIVGILRTDFEPEVFDQTPDVWIAFQIDPDTRDTGGEFCAVTGRLKPGVTLDAARAQLQTVANDYRRAFPDRVPPRGTFTLVPIRDAIVGNTGSSLLLLGCTVGLVLIIASANVANLLLARGANRSRELSIRASLGATRSRIVRQLLTENLVLSITGGALGLAFGSVGIRALMAACPEHNPFILGGNTVSIPRIAQDGSAATTDWRVMLFTLVVIIVTTILFGLLPALRVSKIDLHAGLKGGAADGGVRLARLRALLVTTELGLAIALLVGAALLIRTVLALHAVDPGFDLHHVLTLRMSVSGTPFEKRAGIADLTREGTSRLNLLPGVMSASTTCCVPLETVWQLTFSVVGRQEPSRMAGWTFVSPGYFDVFRIPVVRGRAFTERDTADAPGVVIINESMARRFWPTSDPLNDRLMVGRGIRPAYDVDPVRHIVGIVGDVRDTGLMRNPRPAMYVPVAQVPDGVTALNVKLLPLVWAVRTSGDPHSVAAAVDSQLQTASGGLPTSRVRSMDEVASESTARSRFEMLLMAVFAGAALLLSAIGVYGLMSYAVQQRTREIGIRMALGADRGQVRNMVMSHAAKVTLAGATVGIATALALTRTIAGFLFGVSERDPIVFTAVPVALMAVSLTAAWFPSLRATRVDPATALRHD